MKILKKWMAVFLAVSLVVAGIYLAKPEASEAEAATVTEANEVVDGMLTVKMQASSVDDKGTEDTSDDTIDLRLVSSVNGLGYHSVGFEVWYDSDITGNEGGLTTTPTATLETDAVLKRIRAGVDYEFSPKVIDTSSEYFVTGTIKGIKRANWGKDFYVEAFCTDFETGETKISGVGRYFNIADATDSGIVNIPVEMASAPAVGEALNIEVQTRSWNSTTLDFSTETVKTTEATAVYYDANGYAHLNVSIDETVTGADADKTQMSSASRIIVQDTGEYAIYRNLETSYKKGGLDYTWYSVYAEEDSEGLYIVSETDFVIATDADLWGLHKLTGKEMLNLLDQSVYLISDIVLNDMTIGEMKTALEDDTVKDPYNWGGIGHSTNTFKGCFDGQEHTVRGLYRNASNYVGFFADTGNDATVKNFNLEDSYLIGTGTGNMYAGSIAGRGRGTFQNIYSDAELVGSGKACGGIVGMCHANSGELNLLNCRFAGTISMGTGASYGGGIIGWLGIGTEVVQNCIFDGAIISTKTDDAYIGGIVGGVTEDSVELESCHSIGSVTAQADQKGVFAGGSEDDQEVTLTNTCYTNIESTTMNAIYGDAETVATLCDGDVDLSWYKVSPSEYVIYDAEDLRGVYLLSKSFKGNFAGETIRLGADITFNAGVSVDDMIAALATEDTTDDPDMWTPISEFAGTLDGSDPVTGKIHKISGICSQTSGSNLGFFAKTTENANIRNIRITDSYFKSTNTTTNAHVGSFAGSGGGTFFRVYNQATVHASGCMVGGLVGHCSKTTASFSDCWNAGTIEVTGDSAKQVGGLIGVISSGTVSLSNCLNSAQITVKGLSNAYQGGLIGQLQRYNSSSAWATVSLKQSLNTGDMSGTGTSYVCGVFAYAKYVSLVLEDVYSDKTLNSAANRSARDDYITINGAAGSTYANTAAVEALVGELTTAQLTGSIALDEGNASGLSAAHWVTTEGYPILRCFAEYVTQ